MRRPYSAGVPIDTDNEFRSYTPEAKAGTLLIRALPDADVLAAARDRASDSHAAIMTQMGADTNVFWVTSVAAVTAYDRGLIDEVELDRLTA
jgi:hypothetical protein